MPNDLVAAIREYLQHGPRSTSETVAAVVKRTFNTTEDQVIKVLHRLISRGNVVITQEWRLRWHDLYPVQ